MLYIYFFNLSTSHFWKHKMQQKEYEVLKQKLIHYLTVIKPSTNGC